MMWTTHLGSVAQTRNLPRDAEALLTYARAEFREADVTWYLAQARRAAGSPKAKRSTDGTRTESQAVRATA